MPVFERRGLQRYELFRIPQIFFQVFLRTFFHRGGALNSPFPKRVAKVRFFPLPPNLFQEIFDFFLKRQYKSLAEMPLELQLNRREMTQRQKRGDRKIGTGLRSGGSHGSHDWCPTIRCGLALLRKNIYLLYNSDSRRLSRPVQPVPGIPEKW